MWTFLHPPNPLEPPPPLPPHNTRRRCHQNHGTPIYSGFLGNDQWRIYWTTITSATGLCETAKRRRLERSWKSAAWIRRWWATVVWDELRNNAKWPSIQGGVLLLLLLLLLFCLELRIASAQIWVLVGKHDVSTLASLILEETFHLRTAKSARWNSCQQETLRQPETISLSMASTFFSFEILCIL